MRIHRCPRCRAEDISADAHPSRILDNGIERIVCVCRNCYRACELEFRVACQAADVGYVPLAIRDGLFALRGFYRERLAEYDDPAVLMDDIDRLPAPPRHREAPPSLGRRLALPAAHGPLKRPVEPV